MGKLIMLVLVITSFTGCAVLGPTSEGPRKAYVYDESKSYALNVMTAASRAERLHDMDRPENFDKISPNSNLYSETFDAAYLAMAWSSLSTMGAAATILTPGKKIRAKDAAQTFGWIPASEASNKNEAERLVEKVSFEAVKNTIENEGFESKQTKYRGSLAFTGNGCVLMKLKNACKIGVLAFKGYEGKRRYYLFMVDAVIPEFLKLDQTGFFTESAKANSYVDIGIWGFPKDSPSLTERSIKISKKLPKWMFMYLPQRTSKENKEGFPNLPVLINQGKVHYFFRPE